VKRWAKAKRQEAEKKTITVTKKEDDDSSSSNYSSSPVIATCVGAMVAMFLVLTLVWPVVDSVSNNMNMGNNSTWQVGEGARNLFNLIPVFMTLGIVLIFLKPLLD